MESVGAGYLSNALAACLALASLAPAGAQDGVALQESRRHAATVLEERRERLLALYSDADAEARRRAEGTLERLHSPGAGLVAPPSLRAVDQAARAIAGGLGGWLQELADSLDLRVLPGAFEARAEGRAPLVVIVEPLYPTSGVQDVELALFWLAPDGSEQRARREPVAPAAFQPPGFEMFITAPLGPPAAWRLVAEVERGGERARGIPVVVEGLADLRRRLDALGDPAAGTGAALYREALASLLQRGVRRLCDHPGSALLARLEGQDPDGPRPLAVAWRDEDGFEHWVWVLGSPDVAPEELVILLAASHESPEAALVRPAWAAYARAQRAWVLSTRLPDAAAPLLEELRRHAVGAPTLVVARGDTVGRLLFGLLGRAELPFDGVVFSTLVNDAPGEILPQVPRLLVAPGGHASLESARAAGPATGARFLWLDGAHTPLLNEPALPELCARFVAMELRKGRGEPGH